MIILDSGNPAYSASNPLATPYEYQPITSISGNTLTINAGTRGNYAGTTPHAYFAGATVAAVILAEALGGLAGAFLRSDGGGVGALHAEVYLNGAANVAAGATAITPFDTKISDPNTNFSTGSHQYTCPLAGWYYVTAALNLALNNAPQAWVAAIYKNGAEAVRGQQVLIRGGTTNDGWALVVGGWVNCAANDLLDIRATNTGSNLTNYNPGQAFTWASFRFLGG